MRIFYDKVCARKQHIDMYALASDIHEVVVPKYGYDLVISEKGYSFQMYEDAPLSDADKRELGRIIASKCGISKFANHYKYNGNRSESRQIFRGHF